MDCRDLISSDILIDLDPGNGKSFIVKSCYEESCDLLALLTSNNVLIFAMLLDSPESEFQLKTFVIPLNLQVIDFDLSSSGKYSLCICRNNSNQLFICPGQSLFAEVQANGPWDVKNMTTIDYVPGFYSELDPACSSPTSGSSSADVAELTQGVSSIAVGWFQVSGRDLAVVVHADYAVSVVDLRDQITIAKAPVKGASIVDSLFLKHEKRVLFKTSDRQWYGFSFGDTFSSAMSKVVWSKSSSGSSGSLDLVASLNTFLGKNQSEGKRKRDSFLKRNSISSSKSLVAPSLIVIKAGYYQQFDEFGLHWANSGQPRAKMLIARKKHEIRLFTTLLDPNYCARYSLKSFNSNQLSTSEGIQPDHQVKKIKALFVEEFFLVTQIKVPSDSLAVRKDSVAPGQQDVLEIHFMKFVGAPNRSTFVKRVRVLKANEDVISVHHVTFNWKTEDVKLTPSFLVDDIDSIEPLSSFLIITTCSVTVVHQKTPPEQIALNFGINHKLDHTIDVCIALRINNLKPICNFLAMEVMKRGEFEYALKVFAAADTPLYSQLETFCEHGALDSCFDYFRQLFLKRSYPDQDSKKFAEIVLNCYIMQISSNSPLKSQYLNELSEILRDNFDYTEETILRVLLENELLGLFCQVASQRGLTAMAMSMLTNFQSVATCKELIQAIASFGLVEDYLSHNDGFFLLQLRVSLLLDALGSNVKLAIVCKDHLIRGLQEKDICYYDCFRIASLFNPSKEETLLAVGDLAKTNSNRMDFDPTYLDCTTELTHSGNLTQSIDRNLYERKVQCEIIKDISGIFLKALLLMRKLRYGDDDSSVVPKIEFRSEYLHHVTPTSANEDVPDISVTARARASRSSTLEFLGVQKPLKRKISASSDHLGVITAGGNLYMMGGTSHGKLGVGDLVLQTEYHKALCVETLHMFGVKVKSVACGHMHTVCLTSNGVYAWGSNKYGQLGLGESVDEVAKPVSIPLFNQEKAVLIACGDYHTLVSTRNPRKLYSFGWGIHGQLGTGSSDNCYKPRETRLPANTAVVSINGGKSHSTMLTDTGHVYAWGSNKVGQLGIFDSNISKTTEPIPVKFFNETVTVLQTKGFVNIISTASGRIIKFGCDPNKMQIYISRVKNSRPNQSTKPDTLFSEDYFKAPREIGINADLHEDAVVDFSLGNCHILCLLQSGQVYGCGRNECCQLALASSNVINEAFFALTNVPSCNYIAALKDTSIAIGSDGKCYLWGKVHSGVVEPQQDSVEELHNGFFCISDPTAISEIPNDDFRKPEDEVTASVREDQQVAFSNNSNAASDWSVESFHNTCLASNPLSRLASLPELEEVVELDGWRFGANAIFKSIELLKNYYRFNDVLRMGIRHKFWAFCRNLCALHGYYVRAFVYDLQDLEAAANMFDPTSSPEDGTSSGFHVLTEGFYSGFKIALDNVTELMREDRFSAWKELLSCSIDFIRKWSIPEDQMEPILTSYIQNLEFAGAFHAVLFQMIIENEGGSSSLSDYICSVLSSSFLLNTIESTFFLRHEVLKGLYHGASIKNWSRKKTSELVKFVRELYQEDVNREKELKEAVKSPVSVQMSTQALLNAVDETEALVVYNCGHISRSSFEDWCTYCS